MTESSLAYYEQLHNALKRTPKHLMTTVCKENGLRSWFTNAKQSPNYQPYQLQSQMAK